MANVCANEEDGATSALANCRKAPLLLFSHWKRSLIRWRDLHLIRAQSPPRAANSVFTFQVFRWRLRRTSARRCKLRISENNLQWPLVSRRCSASLRTRRGGWEGARRMSDWTAETACTHSNCTFKSHSSWNALCHSVNSMLLCNPPQWILQHNIAVPFSVVFIVKFNWILFHLIISHYQRIFSFCATKAMTSAKQLCACNRKNV